MTKYREIIRLHCQGYSKRNIALSVPCSRNTVARVADRADELQLKWPLPENTTDAVLEMLLFPRATVNTTERRLPDMQYVRTELQKKVSPKSSCGQSIWSNAVRQMKNP